MRTNFKMENKYIRMVRGDTLSFCVQIMDENGEPFTQDLETAYFTCTSLHVQDGFLFKKTLDDGISKIDTGQYCVRVAPKDTKYAKVGKYFYDLEIGVNDDRFTVMRGILELVQDVTL